MANRHGGAAGSDGRPGRTCPTAYRYAPRVFDREPEIEAATLYVAGGLYGNVEALAEIGAMAAREAGPVTVVFNGDFHWFDAAPADFAAVAAAVAPHVALRGNVETEIAGEDAGAGCGCAYPADVSDADVARSNAILAQLRETARGLPGHRAALAALPMHRVARVGRARVGIVHGDCDSLAGWGFAQEALDDPGHRRWLEGAFADARVDVFASSHTCLPAMRAVAFAGGHGVVANNGAAGMPNFAGRRHGLLTRIGVEPAASALYGTRVAGVHVQALAVCYDASAWERRFLARWPAGTPAHEAYFRRIAQGPAFAPERALPRAA